MSDSSGPIVAAKAVVVPRACRAGSSARLPLEQLVLPHVLQRAKGAIFVLGPPGSGKTTALQHLKAVLPADVRVGYFDEPQFDHWQNVTHEIVAIVSTTKPTWFPSLEDFTLANWTADDCLEYLASAHREQCAALMRRIVADESFAMIRGCPQLLRLVMDRMVADPSIASISDALRRELWDLLPPGIHRNTATNVCLMRLMKDESSRTARDFASKIKNEAIHFLRHGPAQDVLCADAIATMLCEGQIYVRLNQMAYPEMIRQLAAAVRLRPAAIERLSSIFSQSSRRYDAVAASILLAVDPNWRPCDGRRLLLQDALLAGAKWAELELTKSDLTGADLSGADLRLTDLTGANAKHANLCGADLRSATLTNLELRESLISGVDLSYVQAQKARFEKSDLSRAKFQSAHLDGTTFVGTSLRQTNFGQAHLLGANFSESDLADADFSDADLSESTLWHIKMCAANWMHAIFRNATLHRCEMQDLELPGANFERASLRECDLSGTRIPGGNFRGARLCGAGLADIHWEGADLRDADFTYASFHMGSTRCGLVGSDIPCEGSRTGFYTDDYDEHDHLPPEEIRKANLCGADLRGAKVFDTDFYLVDLRGAKYTAEQEEHFAKCRAILHSKVA